MTGLEKMISQIEEESRAAAQEKTGDKPKAPEKQPTASTGGKQSLISVNLAKLDALNDIGIDLTTDQPYKQASDYARELIKQI